MKVYLVHFDTATYNGVTKPAGPVTFRRTREEAQEIANYLNSKRLELMYHEYLAAISNKTLGGGVSAFMAAHTDELRGQFLEATKNEPEYQVTELNIEGDDEEELKKELNKEEDN